MTIFSAQYLALYPFLLCLFNIFELEPLLFCHEFWVSYALSVVFFQVFICYYHLVEEIYAFEELVYLCWNKLWIYGCWGDKLLQVLCNMVKGQKVVVVEKKQREKKMKFVLICIAS